MVTKITAMRKKWLLGFPRVATTALMLRALLLTALLTTASATAEHSPGQLHAPGAVVQLESGPGYHVREPSHAFGTQKTVDLFRRAVAQAGLLFQEMPTLSVGDLSVKGGGRLRPHRSHRDGRDIDVGYYFKDCKTRRWFEPATPKNLDVARTWALIKALLDTHEVEYIFIQSRLQKPLFEYAKKTGISKATLDHVFQWPRARRNKRGIIRHERGHDDHFHVRFTPG